MNHVKYILSFSCINFIVVFTFLPKLRLLVGIIDKYSCYVKRKVECWNCKQKCFEWLIIFLTSINERKFFIMFLVKSFLGIYILKVENKRYAWARGNSLPMFVITYRNYWFLESVIYENWNSKNQCNSHVSNSSKFNNHFLTQNNQNATWNKRKGW